MVKKELVKIPDSHCWPEHVSFGTDKDPRVTPRLWLTSMHVLSLFHSRVTKAVCPCAPQEPLQSSAPLQPILPVWPTKWRTVVARIRKHSQGWCLCVGSQAMPGTPLLTGKAGQRTSLLIEEMKCPEIYSKHWFSLRAGFIGFCEL